MLHPLAVELQRRWRRIFKALAAGNDVAPSQRLRTEGIMEALLLTGDTGEAEINQLMDDCFRECYGTDLQQSFGADWQQFYPFPQIPAVMNRAPVYPSIGD